MKILLVGGGAREHAIAEALKKNSEVRLFAAMKNRNPGIMGLSENVSIHDEMKVGTTVDYALKSGVELAVVGPEAPLAAGMADALLDVGIPCVGPKKALARIESDKEFMRTLLDKHRVPCNLGYRVFSDVKEAWDYLDEADGDVAVKPVGLTGGKGVKVMGEQLRGVADAKKYVKEVIEGGLGGGKVVIEEKAVGEEFTLQAFVDGTHIALMPAVQDHKRAFEGDTGHNTGGMGSYSDSDHLLPFLEGAVYERAGDVIRKTVEALYKETGDRYKGVLYGQFMLGRDLKLIEFNCRFGDPEAMNVLSLLKSGMAGLCQAITDGSLGKIDFHRKASVCKYVVPEGYGIESTGDRRLTIDKEKIRDCGALLYYAAVNEKEDGIYTTPSRSVGVVGIADTIEEAESAAESAVKHISGKGIYHRRDIGTAELIQRKLKRLQAL